jgi:allantoinase
MKADLYLRNGLVVTEDVPFRGGIVVRDGLIAELVAGDIAVEANEVIDLNGKLLMPGMIDSHVHFQEPGRPHWERYVRATMAAAAGGVTTIMDMPVDSIPSTVNRATLMLKREVVRTQAIVDCAQWGGLVDNNLSSLDELQEEGVIGLKGFMVEQGIDDFKRINDDMLYEGLLWTLKTGNVVGVHAENEWLTSYLAAKLQAAGRIDRRAWLESRIPATEIEAINRAVFWAQATGGNLHVLHTTLAAGIEIVANARNKGARVTVETCPHYLFFDEDDFLRMGPILKMGPPLRSRAEVEKLWDCVLAGKVDVICSDHSPSNWEEKACAMDNIWKGMGGVGGVQTMLSVLLTEGVKKRGLGLSHLVRMMSANPARIYGIYPRKGALVPGSDADLVVVDLDKKWTVQEENLFYQNPQSPFVGYELNGVVERTILRGVTVFQDGAVKVDPGFGKVVRRENPFVMPKSS